MVVPVQTTKYGTQCQKVAWNRPCVPANTTGKDIPAVKHTNGIVTRGGYIYESEGAEGEQ